LDASELIIAAKIVLRDPAILGETILVEINWAALDIASLVRIPTLITDDTVDIALGATEGDLPPDYHRDLLSAYSTTNSSDLTIRSNQKVLDKLHSKTKTGAIEDVAASGVLLLVGPEASAAESVDISYYAKPPELVTDNDTLDEHIPAHLAENLLCGKVILKKIPQTDNDPLYIEKIFKLYTVNVETAIDRLRKFYPDAQKAKPVRYRQVRTF